MSQQDTQYVRFQIRGDYEANWNTENPILEKRELAYDITNKKLKIGDGENRWKQLPALSISLEEFEELKGKIENGYYTKEKIDELLDNIDLTDYYNKNDIDTNFYTKGKVDEILENFDDGVGQTSLGDNSVTFASSTSTEEFDETKLPTTLYYKPIIPEMVEEKKNLEFAFTDSYYWGLYPTGIGFRDDAFSLDTLQIGNEYFLECEFLDENNNTIIKTDYFTVSNIEKNEYSDVTIYGNYRYDYNEPEHSERVGFSLYSFFTATEFENLTFTIDENDTKLEKLYKYTDKWGNVRYTVFEKYAPSIADGTTTDLEGAVLTSSVEEVNYDTDHMYKAIRYEALFNSGEKFSVSAGKNSITTGENAVAVGEESIAMGDFTVALDKHNVAIGRKIFTRGYNAAGFGQGATVTGINAVAFNEAGKSLGYASLAFGDHSIAYGAYTVAGGFQSKATKQGAIAVGHLSEATARHSTAIGQVTKANGEYCVVTGNQNTCSGIAALVSGYGNEVSEDYSLVSGSSNTATGYRNIIGGYKNTVSSTDGLVAGTSNVVEGAYNSVFGIGNSVKNTITTSDEGEETVNRSTTILCAGTSNTVSGQANLVAGIDNTVKGIQSIVSGSTNTVQAGNVLVSGNNNTLQNREGTNAQGDPKTFKSDNSVIGGAQNTLNGAAYSLVSGYYNTVSNIYNNVSGYHNTVNGEGNVVGGNNNTVNGNYSLVTGSCLKSNRDYQTVVGKFNITNSNAYFIVGCGRYDGAEDNALEIHDGLAKFNGSIELRSENTGIILKSLNGTRYKLTVDDDGTLITEKM